MELGNIYSEKNSSNAPGNAQKSKSICTPTDENPLRQGSRRRVSGAIRNSSLVRRFSSKPVDLSKSTRESSFRESVAFNSALTYQDTRSSAFHQRQTLVDVVIDEIEVIEDGIHETFHGNHVFHISWGCYMFLLSMIGGAVIYAIDDISFIDAWFNSTSATVNSGLSAISPENHSHSSFVVLAVLMLFGSGPFMLLPVLSYRCVVLSQYREKMENAIRSVMITEESKHVIRQHQLLYDASLVAIFVVVLYIFLCVVSGSILLVIFLPLKAMEPELRERGFSFLQNAIFSSISAFTNAGMLMSPNSLGYVSNNPAVIVVYTALILTGNVMMPVLLRALFVGVQRFLKYCAESPPPTPEAVFATITGAAEALNESGTGTCMTGEYCGRGLRGLNFALNNPRLITTQLFLPMENSYLLQFFCLSNALLFTLFIAVCLTNENFTDAYDSSVHTAFLGLFQNINMRHSGFGILSFRDLPQSMLLVYAVAMFLSPVPYIGVLHASGHHRIAERLEDEVPILTVMKTIVGKAWFGRFILLFLLAVWEDMYMAKEPEEINLWFIMFEFVSAYSLVGVSVGIPGKAYSLSGAFSPLGKITVVAIFLMGKNRALPELSDPVINFKFPELESALVMYAPTESPPMSPASPGERQDLPPRLVHQSSHNALHVICEVPEDEDEDKEEDCTTLKGPLNKCNDMTNKHDVENS